MKKTVLHILLCLTTCFSSVAGHAQQEFQEPEFLYEGILIQNDEEISVAATEAHLETYTSLKYNYAVRIKEMGTTGSVLIQQGKPSKLIVRIGYNSIAPAQVFSIIPFKQKKKQRNIDFIGFYRTQTVNSTSQSSASADVNASNLSGTTNVNGKATATSNQRISYTNLPDYEDRFPQSIVKVSGKKLGNESYILNIPALEVGEYAICFKDADGVLMLFDLSVN